jgi:HPt (histidine-containing phosphotransfer) domain-containing protein
MNNSAPLIDFDFGIKQLSGNKALLFKLLNKFADEYQSVPTQIEQMFADGDYEQARVLIHTIKGAAGNLGCTAIFQSSRLLEEKLRDSASKPAIFDQYCQLLNNTIVEIRGADMESAPPTTPSENVASAENSKTRLIAALENNEFIPDQKLQEMLSAAVADLAIQELITQAINELDYAQALQLIKQH